MTSVRCDCCGRYIKYSEADIRMITPDSVVSYEKWETLCKNCKQGGRKNEVNRR